jgi:hypothetical protein
LHCLNNKSIFKGLDEGDEYDPNAKRKAKGNNIMVKKTGGGSGGKW